MNNIKASDFMLDDWVYAGERLKNVQVSRIYEHGICTKNGFWESEEVSEENLQPILLNREIREQINTKLSEWYDQKKKENPLRLQPKVKLRVENNIGVDHFGVAVETLDMIHGWHLSEMWIVSYVHEIQHLLKTLGISIYINLESDYSEYENY